MSGTSSSSLASSPVQPHVVIVIVSFAINDDAKVDGCIRSLADSRYGNLQIVLCENGGAEGLARTIEGLAALPVLREASPVDRMPAIASKLPRRDYVFTTGGQAVTLLEAPGNLGYAGGINACIAAVQGTSWDAVWIINPDTFPAPDALAALVERQREGGYGMVGSRLVSALDGRVHTWGGIEWSPWLGRGRLFGQNQSADVVPDSAALERRFGFISGASMYATRGFIDAVGVMDDDFFLYCEDIDWCLRGKARGFSLGYAHRSIVRHIHGATTGSSLNKPQRSRLNIYLSERNRVLLARKLFGARWGIAAALALPQMLEYLLRDRSIRQFWVGLQGWWAGVRGEVGPPLFLERRP